jgi:tetratricopeptide (TPR) repeat protein
MVKKKTAVAATPIAPSTKPTRQTAEPKVSAAEAQLHAWEKAMRHFARQEFEPASAAFHDATGGPAAHVADKARCYAQICERKLSRHNLDLRTAEDHFNYGVERLNSRDTEQAKIHLGRAAALEPDADHILYTFALCCGMSGDGNGAYENLKRAIGLDPRNRIIARQDPEFSSLFPQFPALKALLGDEAI